MRAQHLLSIVPVVLLATALSGCSVSVVDPTPKTPSSEQESSSPSTEASQGGPDPAPQDSGLSAEGQAERDRLIDAASTTMPCPDGPLTEDGAIVRVEGSCGELVIEIDAGVVIVDDVDALTLAGSGTTVYGGTLGSVTVTGSASSVFWSGATPAVDDRGTSNTLRKG